MFPKGERASAPLITPARSRLVNLCDGVHNQSPSSIGSNGWIIRTPSERLFADPRPDDENNNDQQAEKKNRLH